MQPSFVKLKTRRLNSRRIFSICKGCEVVLNSIRVANVYHDEEFSVSPLGKGNYWNGMGRDAMVKIELQDVNGRVTFR